MDRRTLLRATVAGAGGGLLAGCVAGLDPRGDPESGDEDDEAAGGEGSQAPDVAIYEVALEGGPPETSDGGVTLSVRVDDPYVTPDSPAAVVVELTADGDGPFEVSGEAATPFGVLDAEPDPADEQLAVGGDVALWHDHYEASDAVTTGSKAVGMVYASRAADESLHEATVGADQSLVERFALHAEGAREGTFETTVATDVASAGSDDSAGSDESAEREEVASIDLPVTVRIDRVDVDVAFDEGEDLAFEPLRSYPLHEDCLPDDHEDRDTIEVERSCTVGVTGPGESGTYLYRTEAEARAGLDGDDLEALVAETEFETETLVYVRRGMATPCHYMRVRRFVARESLLDGQIVVDRRDGFCAQRYVPNGDLLVRVRTGDREIEDEAITIGRDRRKK